MAKLTKRQVTARVKWWQKRLGLTDWEIRIQYVSDAEDGSHAACSAQPEYRFATLYFDLPKIDPAMIERYVCHELVHCFVWRLANCAHALAAGDKSKEEWVRTEEETLTTQLENLLVQLGD